MNIVTPAVTQTLTPVLGRCLPETIDWVQELSRDVNGGYIDVIPVSNKQISVKAPLIKVVVVLKTHVKCNEPCSPDC